MADSIYLYQKPPQPTAASIQSALFKDTPADFDVTENLGFKLSGEGEHLCVYVEKEMLNTGFVANELAKWAGIPERDVGYCGLKDKFAVTRQWFSLRIPKKHAPETDFELNGARLLKSSWHSKKLPRGAHQSNTFSITLKELSSTFTEIGEIQSSICEQLEHIKAHGVPNYFGAQRFGKQGDNVDGALEMFGGRKVKRKLKSLFLSAARSYLFNVILAKRVQAGTWDKPLLGDVFNLEGTGSIFNADHIDDDIIKRALEHDIHPTGALWGCGELISFAEVKVLEKAVAEQHAELCRGLEQEGLKQERRALRLIPKDLAWEFLSDSSLRLTFSLPKGAYATCVLDALVNELHSP